MKSLLKLLKGAGWLNVVGMTLAFAAIYIISVQVNYEFGYNQKIKDIDRLYMVAFGNNDGKYGSTLSRPTGRLILDQCPMVENYCVSWSGGVAHPEGFQVGEGEAARSYELMTLTVTTSGAELFGLKPLSGSFGEIGKGGKIALSESAAKRMGVKVGDVVSSKDGAEKRTVCAVYEDLQSNSMLYAAEAFCSDHMDVECMDNASEWSFVHYVKLHSPEDVAACEKLFCDTMVKWYREQRGNVTEEALQYISFKLLPLKSLYFEDRVENLALGNKTASVTLLIMAIMILLITLINYVNFFMAQVPIKLKSVNTRKILGSTRSSLVFRFIMESGFLVVVSMMLAAVVVLLFKDSSYARFVTPDMAFEKNLMVMGITFFSGLFLTLASSVYPALYITSFPPALALKGTMGNSRSGRTFRYVLVGFQFFVSLVFIISTLFVKKQYDFMMNYDMGFNKENLYTLEQQLPWDNRDLGEELLKSGVIEDITWSDVSLVRLERMGWGRSFNGTNISFSCFPVANNFLRFMGIKMADGRDFTQADEQSENGVFIFNPEARKEYGLSVEDKIYGHRNETDIAGFTENFLFRPLQYGTEPFAFYVFGKHPWRSLNHVYLRARSGATREEVQQTIRTFVKQFMPGINTELVIVRTFDEELGGLYEKEANLIKLITLFSVFAVLISLVGIVGLLTFETAYRRKEIGVRRVNGASVVEILKMFNLQFLRIAFVSFLLAIPVSYWLMDYYYSTFAYRATLSWWVFALAFVVVAFITVVVVTLSSWNAASENPCRSLKNE